jgi:hypothetical protein
VNDLTSSLALAAAAANLLAGAVGAWLWWRVQPDRRFWPLLRAGQAAAVAFALYGGALVLTGEEPEDGLFLLYALLPVAVNVVAEQLRAVSAQTVLDARGLETARALAGRPDAEQRSVLRAILRREMGVMTAGALVVAFLLVRAAASA